MDILDYLTRSKIKYTVLEHEPVFTVAESMEHLPDSYPVKNLLLKEEKGDRYVFVIVKGDERLDVKNLAFEIGSKKLQFAKPDTLMEKLGVEPGSASLFSLLHSGSEGVEVVVDSRVLKQSRVGFHPSINTQTVFIAGKDIETFLSSINRAHRELEL